MTNQPVDAKFAARFVLKRMEGFAKDIQICLRSIRHPTEARNTVAFSPAIGTCCATLEYLASLWAGTLRQNQRARRVQAYAAQYLRQPDYSPDVIRTLYGFRNQIAHRGIISGVWVDRNNGQSRRVGWHLHGGGGPPAIEIREVSGKAKHWSAWPCEYSHCAYIHIRQLSKDVQASANSYAEDLAKTPALVDKFARCMLDVFPR